MTSYGSFADNQINGGLSYWPRRFLVRAFGGLIGIAFLLGAVWWIGGPVVHAETLKLLRGATQAKVRQILGVPSEIQDHGTWIYARQFNPGWVAISFDDHGCVSSINDEQADPVTFGSGSWSK